jgi:hypothetical protein
MIFFRMVFVVPVVLVVVNRFQLICGNANSGPLATLLSGQRCMTAFCRV